MTRVSLSNSLVDLQPGDGGEITLQDGDSQRAIKRRVTTAAKRQNKTTRWRDSQDGVLRFELRND